MGSLLPLLYLGINSVSSVSLTSPTSGTYETYEDLHLQSSLKRNNAVSEVLTRASFHTTVSLDPTKRANVLCKEVK